MRSGKPARPGSASGTTTAQRRPQGFTLIEMLVVMAVLAVLASLVAPRYMERVQLARETVLRQNLVGVRTAIDQFYRDQLRYPTSLDELVQRRYLRAVPLDPITERNDSWTLVPPSEGGSGVFDLHSGAPGRAQDGSAYAQW